LLPLSALVLSIAGGWQDQVGGVFGGVKVRLSFDAELCCVVLHVSCITCGRVCVQACHSRGQLPLSVDVVPIAQSPDEVASIERLINDRVFLLYTGTTRLAKDLLQRVLR
jgi:hypothetical protein